MKLSDIKLGDKVRVVTSEMSSCWDKGAILEVQQDHLSGELVVDCKHGNHYIGNMCDSHGDIPEFEPMEDDKERT